MAYTNKTVSAPVSINDVQRAVGSTSSDVGTLCEAANINPWARWKPVYVPHTSANADGDTPGVLTIAQRKKWNWGTTVDYSYDGSWSYGTVQDWIDGLLRTKNSVAYTVKEVNERVAKGWASMMGIPDALFHRLADFAAANGASTVISGHGYKRDATAATAVVHRVNYSDLYMGAPVFPVAQRSIEVEDGVTCVREIPDDTGFIDAWARSEDLQLELNNVRPTTSGACYTDLLTDCGDCLSPIEVIESYQGNFELTRENVIVSTGENEGLRVNCVRGVAILKYNENSTHATKWDVVVDVCRNNLNHNTSTGYITTKEDDLYYNDFAVSLVRQTGTYYADVAGSGTLTTTPPANSELERHARWLLFGPYDADTNPQGGQGTQPSWYGGAALFGSSYPSNWAGFLRRAITAFYIASREQNGRYVDLTRKGFSNNGTITPLANRVYAPAYDGDSIPEDEGDFLNGQLLVVEYYKRYVRAAGSTALSPYVLIPGYVYFINITRTTSTTTTSTPDITGVIHFGNAVVDSSGTLYLEVYVAQSGGTAGSPSDARQQLLANYSSVSLAAGGETVSVNGAVEGQYIGGTAQSGTYAGYYLFEVALAGDKTASVGQQATLTVVKSASGVTAVKSINITEK